MSTHQRDPAIPRYEILDTELDALTMDDLNARIASAIARNERFVVASHNLHGVYLARTDRDMQAFYELADVHRIDGMSLVLLGRIMGVPLERDHRITWLDWIDPLMRIAAAEGWRVFYLGAGPGVAERGAVILRERVPGLRIATHDGYFDPKTDNERILAEIAAFETDILLVGMGMPRQERWVLQNAQRLPANVVLTCGACIEYIAGEKYTPPRWAGRLGLEWLFRLLSEPGNLWRRYLVEPWVLSGMLLRDLYRRRKRSGKT
jgi:N-acetylglucosaminyldiphosphoundecaprenol N-acetyl-beta-D-mannosaminyltransferase